MTAIPPNNLDQLIAWVRLFAETTSSKFIALETKLKNIRQDIRRMRNEQPK